MAVTATEFSNTTNLPDPELLLQVAALTDPAQLVPEFPEAFPVIVFARVP